MAGKLNPSVFNPYNVVDACGIWNILSSVILYRAATSVSAGCSFCCTNFVHYECLIKPRTNMTHTEKQLKERLINEKSKGKQFTDYHLDIEDLQDLEILENRKKLGKGELSSIVFAKKTGQPFLTDDKGARNLAERILKIDQVQTTPHLCGWLFYKNVLTDSDKSLIIDEHSKFRTSRRGNLSPFFEDMYKKALEFQLMHRANHRTNVSI